MCTHFLLLFIFVRAMFYYVSTWFDYCEDNIIDLSFLRLSIGFDMLFTYQYIEKESFKSEGHAYLRE
jgi:hypothetical protein